MKNANPVSSLLGVLLALAFAGALGGCGGAGPGDEARKPASEYFPVKVGGQAVRMQLAVQQLEMARGLMGRRDLAEDQGMVFVYQKPARMSFYMRNTPAPLDIGYFTADGVLREIYPMYPNDETAVPSRGREMQFALEMNQGWFERHGVRPGAKLDLDALKAAIKARGFPAKDFGWQ
ncbi:MAG: DUF192 domain-containing protein [Opitutaceae bacterium]|nr:DUF192 domain-containing protein [Opitutaceae bacterium]